MQNLTADALQNLDSFSKLEKLIVSSRNSIEIHNLPKSLKELDLETYSDLTADDLQKLVPKIASTDNLKIIRLPPKFYGEKIHDTLIGLGKDVRIENPDFDH